MKYVSVIQNGKIQTSGLPQNTYTFENDLELVQIIEKFIDDDVAFVDSISGWHPVAILENLIDRQLLTRNFKAITWSGPNECRVYDVTDSVTHF